MIISDVQNQLEILTIYQWGYKLESDKSNIAKGEKQS